MPRTMHVSIENGKLEDMLLRVHKMQLEIAHEGFESQPKLLGDEELQIFAEKLLKVQLENLNINMIEARQGEENSDPRIPKLVKKSTRSSRELFSARRLYRILHAWPLRICPHTSQGRCPATKAKTFPTTR